MAFLPGRLAVRVALAAVLVALPACSKGEGEPAGAGGPAKTTAGPCAKKELELVQPRKLTVATDNPALPPWFAGGTKPRSKWDVNDPATGKGYESAVAYAVARELGFASEEMQWVVVPFERALEPGPKTFDFDIDHVLYTDAREENVDFSDSYYEVNQALVALEGNPVARATRVDDLRRFRLGAPAGTTAYGYLAAEIAPEDQPEGFRTLGESVSALERRQVDGLVVDLPTALFVTATQVANAAIVGQFPPLGGKARFGIVFEKGNPLVRCVNDALAALREDGTLAALREEWLVERPKVPVFE